MVSLICFVYPWPLNATKCFIVSALDLHFKVQDLIATEPLLIVLSTLFAAY